MSLFYDIGILIAQTSDTSEGTLETIGKQINWFISIGGAILLSVVGNLATDPVQNFLARRSKQRGYKRVEKIQQEISKLENYESEPLKLIAYSIESLLSILLYFGLAEVILTIDRPIANIFSFTYSPFLDLFFSIIIPLFVGYLYLKAVLIAQDVLTTFNRWKNLARYKVQQESIISRIEAKRNDQNT
jgi:hypothetical protein